MNQVRAAVLETLRAVFSDRYAVVTLIGAVVLYSFFYPVAYRHQVASQYPVLVVDLDHSAMSRALVRKAGAVRAVRIVGDATSVEEARPRIARGEAQGLLVVPAVYTYVDDLEVLLARLFGPRRAALPASPATPE